MPELPEVEVIVRELRGKIIGEEITDIKIFWYKTWIDFEREKLINQKIKKINRKGKYIIIHLSSGFLILHLRMTGQLIVNGDASANAKHLRTLFEFNSGNNMCFYDARKFGRIVFSQKPDVYLAKIGIDAFDKQFTVDYLRKTMGRRTLGLKKFFLDQTNVAGLGNIYIDETLFLSRLHPQRNVGTLSTKEIKVLHGAIQTILKEAIENMGTTISDYKTTGGGFGRFQGRLNVYGRANKPCTICNKPIQKTRINNRGTHFCPGCQPG